MHDAIGRAPWGAATQHAIFCGLYYRYKYNNESVEFYEYSKYELHLLLTSQWIRQQFRVRVTLIITG